jgi:hypothetical protein
MTTKEWLDAVVKEANAALEDLGYFIKTKEVQNGEIRVECESKTHMYYQILPRKSNKLQILLTVTKTILYTMLLTTDMFPEVYETSETTMHISVWRWIPNTNYSRSEELVKWTVFLEGDETLTIIGMNSQQKTAPKQLTIDEYFKALIGATRLAIEAVGGVE